VVEGLPKPEQVAVVSCDLLGHSTTNGADQVRRVAAINDIVHRAIRRGRPGGIVWSSGGDGGHVVFRGDVWQAEAILLILELSSWAEEENAKLRITGHVGPVTDITGADGRIQVVGEGINFAGWLLRQLHSGTRVVSDSFRRAMAPPPEGVEPRFHDERLFFDRKSEPQLLYLMSLGTFESSWVDSRDSDHALLKQALANKEEKGWHVLYHAKRILQTNVKDAEVAAALRTIAPRLKAGDPEQQSLLGLMDDKELAEVLKLGQLVERRPGEAICRYNDPGGSMFVILHGDVGVYNLEGKGFGGVASPKHVHRAGEVVGELGPVLKRARTADLVALTDVGLLSFDSEEVLVRLSTTPEGRKAARQFEQFITGRLLEHTCQGASYLVGLNRTGPLTIGPDGTRPRDDKDDSIWKETLRELRPHSRSITVEQGPLTLEFDHLAERGDGGHGLYVLVSGRLRSTDAPKVDLHGAQFPVLWVDLPGVLSQPLRSYIREQEPIMILRIDAEGIRALPIQQRKALRDSLEGVVGEVPEEYEYQVYLCHATPDKTLVRQIQRRFEKSGIKSWYDEVQLSEGGSVLSRMENGLRSSRYLLVCASENFMTAPWGMREYESVMNLEVKRRAGKVLVLRLYENESDDASIPLLVSGNKRWRYWIPEEFESLITMLDDRGRSGTT
jgi:CRP-like cAMP-binding protein